MSHSYWGGPAWLGLLGDRILDQLRLQHGLALTATDAQQSVHRWVHATFEAH